MRRFRLEADVSAWIVNSNKKINLPKSTLIAIDSDFDNQAIGVLVGLSEYAGSCIKITPEIKQALADVDAESRKAKYKESLDRCLALIVDGFDTLPVIDTGTPTHIMRDLGLASEWLGDMVENKKIVRSWLHHMNMKIPHPSLSVEKAMFNDKELHFVLYLTQTW